MLITIDFETYWDSKAGYSLKNMSAIDYIRDPRFHVQMMGINIWGKYDGPYNKGEVNKTFILEGWDNISMFIDEKFKYGGIDPSFEIVVGHNINGFDGLILSEIFGWRPVILDTIALMRWTGLARIMGVSLKKMTEHFGTGEKTAGTVISDGKRTKEDFTPEEWEAFRQYCIDDVNQTAACARIMYEYIGGKTIEEVVKFSNITGHMATEPVFYIDKAKVKALLEEEHQRVLSSRAALQKYFHLEEDEDFRKALRSAKKFTSMLQSLGVEPPLKVSEAQTATKQKKHPGEIIEPVMVPALSKQDLPFLEMQNHPDERVATLVRARLENNSSVLESRLKNMLHFAEQDKPVPVMLKVFSAHTSRYGAGNSSGKTDGLQFQNLPKRDPRMLEVRKAIRVKPGYKVVAADSSQVEARIVAYIANQYDLLDAYRMGADPYSDLAEAIFHIPSAEIHEGNERGDKICKKYRNVAKTAILGCSYGVGYQTYSNALLRAGAKLSEDPEEHLRIARNAHTIYRQRNASIVALWDRCDSVIRSLIMGSDGYFGGPTGALFHYTHKRMPNVSREVSCIELPSGYTLWYPNLRSELNDKGKMEFVYDRTDEYGKLGKYRIYGSGCTENITQSLAFQVLMYQANRMYEAGIKICCNIHDSWATVVPADEAQATADKMVAIMRTPPPWLTGCPLNAGYEITDDFTGV